MKQGERRRGVPRENRIGSYSLDCLFAHSLCASPLFSISNWRSVNLGDCRRGNQRSAPVADGRANVPRHGADGFAAVAGQERLDNCQVVATFLRETMVVVP